MTRAGQYQQEDHFNLIGGLNTTDSPFTVKNSQATEGRNYEYLRTGGFKKRLGTSKINSIADSQLKSLGLGLRLPKSGDRQTLRMAGTKIQKVDVDTGTFTALTEDTTAASSDILAALSTQPVATTMMGTSTTDVLWMSGAGMSDIYGAYSGTKVTANGVDVLAGSVGQSVAGSGGSFLSTGTYFYAFALRKASTQALGNAGLDVSATISSTTEEVTLDLSTITSFDTTKYDKIYIYRSAVGGASAFTTGDLIAQVNSTDTSYVDLGTSISTSENIPRAGNLVLDNSKLPTGTYKYTTLFKRRLVTAKDSTIYLSDINKPENWPTVHQFQIPSGGEIKGLAIISFITPTSSNLDEFLVVFKENELWVLTGTGFISAGLPDWSLKKIDTTGCDSHNSIVFANGYLYWWNKRGIFMWDGSGKPMYLSRPIEDKFANDGDIDKSKLLQVWGQFFERKNQVIWAFSDKVYGEQKGLLKLDLRLTLPSVSGGLANRVLEGVFTVDTMPAAMYAASAQVPLNQAESVLLAGDDAGFMYKVYDAHSDGGSAYNLEYYTNFLNQNLPGVTKQYHKVVAWVEDFGDWNLDLEYWTNYRTTEGEKSTNSLQISSSTTTDLAIWDIAEWDTAYWDDYQSRFKPLVFNLARANNNAVGDAIKLAFKQTGADEPVFVAGFSIIYSIVGVDK